MWQVGGVVGFWINYGVSLHIPTGHKQWVIAFAVQLIVSLRKSSLLYNFISHPLFKPGGLLLIGSLFLTESPRWLVSRDRNNSAMKSLCNIRHLPPTHPYIAEEMTSIEATIQHERNLAGAGFLGPLRAVFASKALILRLILGSSMFVWQNATGINAINYYSYVLCVDLLYSFKPQPSLDPPFLSQSVSLDKTTAYSRRVYTVSSN